MKSNIFTLLLFILFSSFYSFSQVGVYDVTFVGLNTPTTVSPGDILQVDIVQGFGIPNHGCANLESTVTYNINYYLVDQVTSTSYFVSSTNIWSVGVNCASTNTQQWNNPGVQDVTVPCNLPTGDYYLRIEIDNALSFVNGPQGASGMYFYADDVNIGNTIQIDYLNNPSSSGDPLFADLIDLSNSNPSTNTITDITISTVDPTCGLANGSITATPVGGVGPFTYQWYSLTSIANPPFYSQSNTGITSQTATGLGEGLYSVTVTDQGTGCVVSLVFDMNEVAELINPYTLDVSETVTQPCNYDEGAIDLNPVNGVGPYNYEWDSGDQSASLSNLTEGNYSVTVTDGNGCIDNINISLTNTLQPSDFDYPNGLEITSPSQQIEDLNNDGVIRIRGALVFKPNVNYSFSNKTIEFARDDLPFAPDQGHTHSGVIVEPKAKVTATNVTFKGLTTCNRMWDGIQVWGDDFNIVQNNGNSKNFNTVINLLKNGKLNLNSCTVQDAHVGVALYRRNVPFIANPPEYGRGLMHAKSTDFINNNVGVDFQSKNNVVNNSTIVACDFIANAALIETGVYNGLSSDVFIRLQGVRKPFIAANTFNGMASSPIGERGTGIRSYGAGYVVESGNTGPVTPNTPPNPNVFNDLDQGIDIYSFGGAVNTVRIKDNRFNNVYQGVTANGSNFDEISYNVFNIPVGDINFNSWGLFLQTSSGFLATENTFNTSGTNDYTFGAVTRDVNLMNGELYKNTFSGDFSSATQAEGSANNQLQIDCNRYLGNNEFDWTVLSADLADQGECLPDPSAPATNIFNPCSAANESNIFSVANFDYATDPLFGPNCYSTSVFLDPCTNPVVSYENACPQIVTSPCPPCIVALGQQLDFTPPGLKRRKIKGELIRRLAQKGDVQQLVTVLTSEALPEDKKIIIPTRVKRKEFTEAREVMDSLEVNTFEDQKFVELFDVLITLGETERELEDLTPAEKSIIENVAYSSTEVSVQAEAVLAELNKSRYIRFPQGLPANTAMMMASDDSGTLKATKQPLQVSVYPNPSEGDVVIAFEEAQEALGYIVDATGRKVRKLVFNENDVHYEVTGLAHGFYTVFIHYTDGSTESKRLVIK